MKKPKQPTHRPRRRVYHRRHSESSVPYYARQILDALARAKPSDLPKARAVFRAIAESDELWKHLAAAQAREMLRVADLEAIGKMLDEFGEPLRKRSK